jgi:cytochrome c oxidase cbb3-type subunit 2
MSHEVVEKNIGLLAILVVLVVSVGGLVEIVPLFALNETTEPAPGVKKYSALHIEGRDIYVREGCYNCHSQMIRPFRAETERYGHYSVAGESVYDHPFQWGSKRTGPDLARVGGRYSDDWHYAHLNNPRDVVPESNMPSYPWLFDNVLDGGDTATKMKMLNIAVGATCPKCELYTEADMANAQSEVAGKTEAEALVAYLQGLGLASKTW